MNKMRRHCRKRENNGGNVMNKYDRICKLKYCCPKMTPFYVPLLLTLFPLNHCSSLSYHKRTKYKI